MASGHTSSPGASCPTRRAAFFRLEGVMHPAGAWAGAAYLASNAASMRTRLLGLGGAAFSGALRGVSLAGAGIAGAQTTKLAYSTIAGFSRDRVEVLGEDYARDVLVPEARDEAVRLVEGARRDGLVTVLLAESIAPIADAFVRLLAKDGPTFDVVVANQLELDDRQRATGSLLSPIISPEIDPKRLRELASLHAIDLTTSRAYGRSRADLVLLGLVGQPCAIEPDRELARVARDLDWPIVRARTPYEVPANPDGRELPDHDEGASL
ncbi:MAG: haloacid dehalogenase-like hydrolase [Deltaproteobacteria bacterium]|nr:haloacid dehalogenase-like hydrolase [Deltaproteobacteria bacterium]